jgi:16S rRNA (guanine527-N7)-methyltransferase
MKDFSKKYYDLLVGEYSGINLTRITDYDEFYTKQIIDSIGPVEQSETFLKSLKRNGVMVDVGFGGGFPILPMAKKFPNLEFVGIETRNKKVTVVSEIADKLNLKNIYLHHSRIENVLIDREVTITFKAVGKVNDFLSKLNCTKKCQVFFYKGPNFYELEKDQIGEAIKNWDMIEEKEINVQGVEKRYLIGFENKTIIKEITNKRFNNLVKLSVLH